MLGPVRVRMQDVGAYMTQGTASHMEDHIVACPLPGASGLFAAIFDGHAGDACAQFCASRLFSALVNNVAFSAGEYETALSAALLAVNDEFLKDESSDASGSTACVLLQVGNELVSANVGDSRAVLRTAEGQWPEVQLTWDHSPDDETELARIWEAGGDTFDAEDGQGARVVGPDNVSMVACSRSIGDRLFKAMSPPLVPATADTSRHRIAPGDHFAVIASDGIWDVCPNKRACDVVAEALASGKGAQGGARALCEEAAERRSEDNLSAVVLVLNRSNVS